jgi:hypothetical protein
MSKPGSKFANTELNNAPLFLDEGEERITGNVKREREKDKALIIK